MGVSEIAVSESNSGLMNKGSLDRTFYRKMALLISSCWLRILDSLFFVFRVIGLHIFRIRMKDDSCALEIEDSEIWEPLREAIELEERRNCSLFEEEASSFSFKFEHQFTKDTKRTDGESENPVTDRSTETTTTEISKYCFLPKKDFSGFIEEPGPMTFLIQESYSECDEVYRHGREKLAAAGLMSAEDSQQFNSFSDSPNSDESEEEETPVIPDTHSIGENDSDGCIDDISRLSPAKDVQESSRFSNLNEPIIPKDVVQLENKLDSMINLLDEKDSGTIMEEPEAMSNSDCCEDELGDKEKLDTEITSDIQFTKDFQQPNTLMEFTEKEESKYELLEEDIGMCSETSSLDKNEKVRVMSESFSDFDSDTESVSVGYTVKDLVVDSYSDGFLSEWDFDEHGSEVDATQIYWSSNGLKTGQSEDLEEFDRHRKLIYYADSSDGQFSSSRSNSNRLSSSDESFFANKDFGGEESGNLSEVQYSESDNLRNSNNSATELDSSFSTDNLEQMDAILLQREPDVAGQSESKNKSEETQAEDLNSEDSDELEPLWEHQFLIEQLKMELRKVRSIGLPTIFEESESPKTNEDLKPWKIHENLLHENPMDELHKFYKSYRERMRKFDILNYQKMYAIGFLRLKDPLQSIGSQKPLIPTIMTHLSESFWPFCRPKSSSDPSEKFLKELQSDLETIYVGQTCLSWEFLRWQYEKTRGLPESDPYRNHQYNQVAGEFQQFQVIIQRFIENEPFQGPRLPNYVKNRCVLRNLIQVPVIKEDCFKDKMEEQKTGSDVITSEMLEEIMEEAIRIFWEFIKADKNEGPMILKGFIGGHVELQDPSDSVLLMDIQALLQKRDKKLKDIVRSGNCLVKKFKKPQEHRLSQDLFFCQVDMKLVSMVIKMSRISTEQLVWCHKKLNKITIVDRKIQREPSFLLFPC